MPSSPHPAVRAQQSAPISPHPAVTTQQSPPSSPRSSVTTQQSCHCREAGLVGVRATVMSSKINIKPSIKSVIYSKTCTSATSQHVDLGSSRLTNLDNSCQFRYRGINSRTGTNLFPSRDFGTGTRGTVLTFHRSNWSRVYYCGATSSSRVYVLYDPC